MDELVEAVQGLSEVSTMIRELKGAPSTLVSTLSLSEAEVAAMVSTFACAVCKGYYILNYIYSIGRLSHNTYACSGVLKDLKGL